MLEIVKATKDSEAGMPPSEALLAAVGRSSEELPTAGAILASAGLRPGAQGNRVRYGVGTRPLIDGPFA